MRVLAKLRIIFGQILSHVENLSSSAL